MKLLLAKFALAAFSLVLFLGLAEGGARALGYEPEKAVNPLFSWTGAQGELWRLKPNSRWHTRVGGHEVRTNRYGLRDQDPTAKRPDTLRILALGDSVTFGHGQPADVIFVHRLQQILNQSGTQVEVLNAGVPGWSTRQQRLFYEQYGDELDPDLILVGFVLNDVTEIHRGLMEIGGERGFAMIRGISWLAERSAAMAAFKRLYARVARPEAREIRSALDLAEQPERPEVRYAMERTLQEFRRLAALARERGDEFAVVLFPFAFQFRDPTLDAPQRRLREFGEQEGIPVLDTLPELRAYKVDEVLMDWDHFTAKGHRVVARAIAAWLEEEALLPPRAEGSS